MTVKDISNGPDWILWVVFAILAIMSILLLTGHGKGLIAGYNTASKKTQEKYDEKKLCRVTGIGMSILTIIVLIMAIWETVLPAYFVYIFLAVTAVDIVFMLILENTICKK